MTSAHRSRYSVSPKLEKYKEGYTKVNQKIFKKIVKVAIEQKYITFWGTKIKMPFDTLLGTKDNRIISLR